MLLHVKLQLFLCSTFFFKKLFIKKWHVKIQWFLTSSSKFTFRTIFSCFPTVHICTTDPTRIRWYLPSFLGTFWWRSSTQSSYSKERSLHRPCKGPDRAWTKKLSGRNWAKLFTFIYFFSSLALREDDAQGFAPRLCGCAELFSFRRAAAAAVVKA